ncbi:MAG TPA: dihydrofolate reductase family protein [Aggregatilineales bacterium]|nr:dihydrofolate reductase family protein [Aggregatilineales bacterium]
MGKVITGFTMSLDGFIAGPNDDIGPLFKWYRSGEVEIPLNDGRFVAKVSAASAAIIQEWFTRFGAIVTGRRDFDVSRAWGGKSPMEVPMFIVTHHPPAEWVYAGSPFNFVTTGVEAALEQAQQAAGERDVLIGGTRIVQQLLKARLLDEIHIELAPLLLGSGIRLFDQLPDLIELEPILVVDTPSVTHLKYRVIK